MTGTAHRNHGRTALWIGGIALAMFGLGFGLAPFYGQICAALGIQVADAPRQRAVEIVTPGPPAAEPVARPVTVRFDANVHADLPWDFAPVTRKMEIETGRLHTASYTARNNAARTITGRAVVNVTPWQATPYVDKVECFCFQEQTLEAGAEVEMPLRFAVLPDLPREFNHLTVSYTFMNTDPDAVARPHAHDDGHDHTQDQAHETAHEPAKRHAG
ncbi:MAG: cytochrome c oxidase assembly protein [Gammaproteobacteria bacterium]|nr:cytochrome c oxidase assembly protein [Gammaproteobacteria bacterium]